jgi:hypothetical protein
MPVKLRSCNTGDRGRFNNQKPIAQELSHILGTTVVAPSWYYHSNHVDNFAVGAYIDPIGFGNWNHFTSGEYTGQSDWGRLQ